jgi:hypothetical protein
MRNGNRAWTGFAAQLPGQKKNKSDLFIEINILNELAK